MKGALSLECVDRIHQPSPLIDTPTTGNMDKRKDPPSTEGVLVKRQKPEDAASPANAVAIQTKGASGALIQTVQWHLLIHRSCDLC